MKQTRLNQAHKKMNAKMIEFVGWEMPIQYSGIIEEHMAVREHAGVFDVSHMGEILVIGPDALAFIQHLTPNNAAKVNRGKAQYSALTTPEGTFIDDLLIYNLDETTYLLIVNAANISKDFDWIDGHRQGFNVRVKNLSKDYSQIALQGRKAGEILQPLTAINLSEMESFGVAHGQVMEIDSIVSRTGYTGEDGYEVYTTASNPDRIWNAILEQGKGSGLQPIGLGARDTLRLESCLMLYGNDIDDTTTVLEAGLRWLIKFKKGDFLGRDALLKQKEEGITRKLSGFEIKGRGIARPHYPVFVGGHKVSEVTSGTHSPYLKKSIGLAYLPIESSEPGTEIQIEIRGGLVAAEVVALPFYKRDY